MTLCELKKCSQSSIAGVPKRSKTVQNSHRHYRKSARNDIKFVLLCFDMFCPNLILFVLIDFFRMFLFGTPWL